MKIVVCALFIACLQQTSALSIVTFSMTISDYEFVNKEELNQRILKATSAGEKVFWMGRLAILERINRRYTLADSIAYEAIKLAEISGDQRAIFRANEAMAAVHSWGLYTAAKDDESRFNSALGIMLELSGTNKWSGDELMTFLRMADFLASKSDFDKADEFLNRFESTDMKQCPDSLLCMYYLVKSNVATARGELVNAFRNLLSAKKYALTTPNSDYTDLVNYETADIYYKLNDQHKSIELFEKYKAAKTEKQQLISLGFVLEMLGNLKGRNDTVLQEEYLKQSKAIAEANGIDGLTYDIEWQLWELYLEKGLVNKMDEMIQSANLGRYALGTTREHIYHGTRMEYYLLKNQPDSCEFYLQNALRCAERLGGSDKVGIFNSVSKARLSQNKPADALKYTLESLQISRELESPDKIRNAFEALDKIYVALNDYPAAYASKDSADLYAQKLEEMSRGDEILKAEIKSVEDEEKLIAEAESIATAKRHNMQYMGMAIGIFALLAVLLLIGFFELPNWIFRALGFLSFVFLFEFIILILDKRIHQLTHGEPLPIVLIKIGIACILVPLHHYLEHNAISFLKSRKLHKVKEILREKHIAQ